MEEVEDGETDYDDQGDTADGPAYDRAYVG